MKNLILVTLIIVGLAACSKKKSSTPTPPPGATTVLKMKANGVSVELNYTPIWTHETDRNIHGFGITENKTGTEAPERKLMSIRIQQADFVVGGTHQVGLGNNNEFIYMANHSNVNGQYKTSKNFPTSHGTFTLTKIKDGGSTLRQFYGSFSGTVVNIAGDSIVITDGQIIE